MGPRGFEAIPVTSALVCVLFAYFDVENRIFFALTPMLDPDSRLSDLELFEVAAFEVPVYVSKSNLERE